MLNTKLRGFRIVSDERGLTTVEYVIVLALIAALSVGVWQKFGANVKGYIVESTNTIEEEMNRP